MPSDNELKKFEDNLLEKVSAALGLSDLGLIGTTLKAIAETRAASSELATRRNYRLEKLKSLSSVLVPSLH